MRLGILHIKRRKKMGKIVSKKLATKDDWIFSKSFHSFKIYKINSLEDYIKQREKDTGLKNIFLEKIDSKKPRKKIIKIILDKLGIKLTEKKK
tara:strand:+ start:16 stop:294 length:279 start_codon:yes stop_codon:yes gene_type:complete